MSIFLWIESEREEQIFWKWAVLIEISMAGGGAADVFHWNHWFELFVLEQRIRIDRVCYICQVDYSSASIASYSVWWNISLFVGFYLCWPCFQIATILLWRNLISKLSIQSARIWLSCVCNLCTRNINDREREWERERVDESCENSKAIKI